MTDEISGAGDAAAGTTLPAWKQAVGYLRGRGGDGTVRPDETQAEWREEIAAIRAKLDGLEASAVGLEAAMAAVGEALIRSQPQMYNRVAVRGWRTRTDSRRESVLVRLASGAGGRVKMELVGPFTRLRTVWGFGLCADLAKRAVAGYRALREVRLDLAAQVAEVQRVVGRGDARRRAVIDRVAVEAMAIHDEAVGRLRDVGYVVDGDY